MPRPRTGQFRQGGLLSHIRPRRQGPDVPGQIPASAAGSRLAGLAGQVERRVKANEGENMRFFDVEILKGMSVEDMKQLRREMKDLHRRVREEIDSRERHCAYCGELLGTSVRTSNYCCAWHKYLDSHKNTATVSRVEFERKRAISRISMIKEEAEPEAAPSESSSSEGAAELKATLRNVRIRRVLNEFRTITGENLNSSIRDH